MHIFCFHNFTKFLTNFRLQNVHNTRVSVMTTSAHFFFLRRCKLFECVHIFLDNTSSKCWEIVCDSPDRKNASKLPKVDSVWLVMKTVLFAIMARRRGIWVCANLGPQLHEHFENITFTFIIIIIIIIITLGRTLAPWPSARSILAVGERWNGGGTAQRKSN